MNAHDPRARDVLAADHRQYVEPCWPGDDPARYRAEATLAALSAADPPLVVVRADRYEALERLHSVGERCPVTAFQAPELQPLLAVLFDPIFDASREALLGGGSDG